MKSPKDLVTESFLIKKKTKITLYFAQLGRKV